MSIFTSSREKRLWLCVLLVIIAIYSTLFLGQPLAELFESQDFRAAIFLLVMLLIGTTILIHAIKTKPSKTEITFILGIIAVYIMFTLRLGMPERSHLMEYSVLAIFVHQAINERLRNGKQIPVPALISFILTFLIGVIDECIQLFLPNRVFDTQDIVFNGMAAVAALGTYTVILWIRKFKNSN